MLECMGPLLLALAVGLILLDVAVALWGAESRPGFDGRPDVKERWFIHDRNDRY
jgi:hypothetical protein